MFTKRGKGDRSWVEGGGTALGRRVFNPDAGLAGTRRHKPSLKPAIQSIVFQIKEFLLTLASPATMIFDILFYAAAGAFGWGLSLATYRLFALHYGWPMGELHVSRPVLPVILGLACLIVGFVFALRNRGEIGGWSILFAGLFLAVLWTGLLRVASQWSLFLAPLAAGLIVLGWVLAPLQQ